MMHVIVPTKENYRKLSMVKVMKGDISLEKCEKD